MEYKVNVRSQEQSLSAIVDAAASDVRTFTRRLCAVVHRRGRHHATVRRTSPSPAGVVSAAAAAHLHAVRFIVQRKNPVQRSPAEKNRLVLRIMHMHGIRNKKQ